MATEDYAKGGIIDEPVAGIGLATNQPHRFGEAGHECRCKECDPSLLAQSDAGPGRQGEHHFAVRFGDIFLPGDGKWMVVTVDGERVKHGYETLAGADGVSYAFSDPLHLCRRCGEEACVTVRRGMVAVSIGPEFYDAA